MASVETGDCKETEHWKKAVNKAKLQIRSELTLDEWQKYGFATRRAAEFDELAARQDSPAGAVARFKCSEFSREDFWENCESKRLPCVISGIPEAEGWPGFQKWTWDNMAEKHGGVRFKVGKDDNGATVRLRVEHFMHYKQEQEDDSPVYLFDNQMGGGKTREEILQDFKIPSYFPDDFMALAGEDDRPPYRWFSLGPRRSGTVMHQDPLATSAWNTCLVGRKRWVLLRPEVPRSVAKGKKVMQKDDDDEAVNCFIDLLPRLRDQGVETIEFVQYPGETVFVPGYWWHCVVNLDDTIAVTQNYTGRHNFSLVWKSTRVERPCWCHKWLREMDAQRPDIAAEARRINEQDNFDMNALLVKNRERRLKRRQRREDRVLRRVKRKAGDDFSEAAWRKKHREEKDDSSNSDSTVSTSSSDSASTSSSDDSGESATEKPAV